jgi:hypothetical protein
MTRTQFMAYWTDRGNELKRIGAIVDGERLISEFLNGLDALFNTEQEQVLTLRQASNASGYSRDHLARLIKTGVIPNAGRRGSPRVRQSDLPRKTSNLRGESESPMISDSNKRQIALSVVTSDKRDYDG